MNELKFIDWLRNKLKMNNTVILGPGDDCAILDCKNISSLSATIDTLLEGTHFSISDSPYKVGKKSLAVNLSDLAAMGCKPLWALAGMGFRKDIADNWLYEFAQGIIDCSQEFDIPLVGGDFTSGSGPLSISITALGTPFAEKEITRSGANMSDLIITTGTLGGSIIGSHLDFTPRITESEWLCHNATPSAMMDISDGLALDLRRLCIESKCGAKIYKDMLPISDNAIKLSSRDNISADVHAACDGEDFELLFTVDNDKWQIIQDKWPFETQVTKIGEIVPHFESDIILIDESGIEGDFYTGGFVHE
jgi:thiamine-monophosphate kinase